MTSVAPRGGLPDRSRPDCSMRPRRRRRGRLVPGLLLRDGRGLARLLAMTPGHARPGVIASYAWSIGSCLAGPPQIEPSQEPCCSGAPGGLRTRADKKRGGFQSWGPCAACRPDGIADYLPPRSFETPLTAPPARR